MHIENSREWGSLVLYVELRACALQGAVEIMHEKNKSL